jgi:phage-related minor tail protein
VAAKDLVYNIIGDSKSAVDAMDKFGRSIEQNTEGGKSKIGAFATFASGALAALGIGAALGAGIDRGLDIDEAQHTLAAQLGTTVEDAKSAGALAGKLYSNAYGDSIEDVSGAIQSVVTSIDGMRNASEESVEATTTKLLNLRTAFGVDVPRSAQLAGQAVKAGLADNTDQAIDLLVAHLQRVPENLRGDLLDAVDEYGPILAQMGFTGEEAFGMLAAAADQGMYGIDKTGDALKELSIRATDMSTASIAAYEAAGLNAQDMAAKFAAGGDSARAATNELTSALLGIEDPVARSNAAIALFGTPLEDLGTSEIPTFLDNLLQVQDGFGDTAGAADKMGDTLNGSARVGWEQISRTWEAIIGQVGEFLVPVLSEVIGVLNQNPAILQVVAAALGVLAVAFVGVTIAQWALNTAMLANPITWIILGIVALIAAIVLLIANWDAVVAWVTEVWGGFLIWLTEVMLGFIGWWNGVWSGFAGWIGGLWDGIVAWITGVWTGFLSWLIAGLTGLGAFWNTFWATLGTFVQNAWQSWIVTPITNAVTWVWNTIQTGLGWISTAWNNTWTGLSGVVRGIWNGILGFIESGVNGAIDLINGMTGGIRDVLGVIGISIGVIPHVNLPRLATGGVTTGPTIALIGDNPGGREIVQPLEAYYTQAEELALAVARAAPAAAAPVGSGGPVRWAREDLDYMADRIGQTVYPLIMSGAQRTVRAALGG